MKQLVLFNMGKPVYRLRNGRMQINKMARIKD